MLQHPSFQEIINVAARATNGVKIDNLRNTCEGILPEFKRNVTALSKHLNVRVFVCYYLTMAHTLLL